MPPRHVVACALAFLAATLAVPSAVGHGGAWEVAFWMGDETVLVEVHDAPIPVAGMPLTLRVQPPERADAPPSEVRAHLVAPDGRTLDPIVLEPVGEATYEAPLTFDGAGAWRLVVFVADERVEGRLDVYPEGDVFVGAHPRMASQGVFVAGAPANLTLQVADAQGRQVAVADDAVAHVETWDPSGTELLASEEKPLRHLAGTAYVVQATWAEPALVRVRVESATWGLQPDDRPGVEMLVVSEEEASIYQPDDAPPRDVPALSWAAALAALASVAVLLRTRRR